MKRLLLVDDDEAMLFAFQKLCVTAGVSVEIADSLESALLLLSRQHFDIIISDLNLTGAGGQEGFEVVRAAKISNPLVRAYIMTAYDEQGVREKVMESGIEGYLTLPVKFGKLLSIINNQSVDNVLADA